MYSKYCWHIYLSPYITKFLFNDVLHDHWSPCTVNTADIYTHLSPHITKFLFNDVLTGQVILQNLKRGTFSKSKLHLGWLNRKAVKIHNTEPQINKVSIIFYQYHINIITYNLTWYFTINFFFFKKWTSSYIMIIYTVKNKIYCQSKISVYNDCCLPLLVFLALSVTNPKFNSPSLTM